MEKKGESQQSQQNDCTLQYFTQEKSKEMGKELFFVHWYQINTFIRRENWYQSISKQNGFEQNEGQD